MSHHDMPGHDMPGHDHPSAPSPACSMHMLWNTQILNTCIVFPSWHISSHTSFILSFIAIVLLGVLYEYLRLVQRQVDAHIALALAADARGKRSVRSGSASPVGGRDDEDRELLTGRKIFRADSKSGVPVPFVYRLLRAGIYGSTVFLSFFLMLVFMTYNAYLILAVVVGAAIGHFKFGARMNTEAVLVGQSIGKGMACH